MKTEIKSAPDISALNRSTDLTTSDLSDESAQSDSVQASQTQSNQIQPYPPPNVRAYPTKSDHIRPNPSNFFRGKETVKLLAIFDHLTLQPSTFNLQLASSREIALF